MNRTSVMGRKVTNGQKEYRQDCDQDANNITHVMNIHVTRCWAQIIGWERSFIQDSCHDARVGAQIEQSRYHSRHEVLDGNIGVRIFLTKTFDGQELLCKSCKRCWNKTKPHVCLSPDIMGSRTEEMRQRVMELRNVIWS
jgi:hypothetical protein